MITLVVGRLRKGSDGKKLLQLIIGMPADLLLIAHDVTLLANDDDDRAKLSFCVNDHHNHLGNDGPRKDTHKSSRSHFKTMNGTRTVLAWLK